MLIEKETTLKKYDLILLDPPYQYDNQQQNDPARGGIGYSTMTIDQLAKIPIGNCGNYDSVMISWVTFPKLTDRKYDMDFFDMIRAWDYEPVTALFVWVKTNKLGAAITEETNLEEYTSYYSGLGRYTNSNVEVAFISRRGKGLTRSAKNVKQLIIAPIAKHSEKPQEQYKRIDALYPDASKIELFARKQNPPPSHYDATGFDYDGVDIKQWIKQYAY